MNKAEKVAAAKAAAAKAAEAAQAAAAAEAAAEAGSDDWDDAPAEATAEQPASEFDGEVKVRCIVHTRPFTHKKALNHGEEASVPQEVAATMLKRKQVELV